MLSSANNRIWVAIIVVALTLIMSNFDVLAQSYDPDQDLPSPTKLEKRLNKLGRGISNVLFGWTEVPVTWNQKMKQGKPLTYLLTTAPVLGVARAFMRTGTGIYEVVTFTGPHKRVSYEALIEPDYLF